MSKNSLRAYDKEGDTVGAFCNCTYYMWHLSKIHMHLFVRLWCIVG